MSFAIEWVTTSAKVSYFEAGKYMLKRKAMQGGYLYEVWEHEAMMFNTWLQPQFMRLARKILSGERFNWCDYRR